MMRLYECKMGGFVLHFWNCMPRWHGKFRPFEDVPIAIMYAATINGQMNSYGEAIASWFDSVADNAMSSRTF